VAAFAVDQMWSSLDASSRGSSWNGDVAIFGPRSGAAWEQTCDCQSHSRRANLPYWSPAATPQWPLRAPRQGDSRSTPAPRFGMWDTPAQVLSPRPLSAVDALNSCTGGSAAHQPDPVRHGSLTALSRMTGVYSLLTVRVVRPDLGHTRSGGCLWSVRVAAPRSRLRTSSVPHAARHSPRRRRLCRPASPPPCRLRHRRNSRRPHPRPPGRLLQRRLRHPPGRRPRHRLGPIRLRLRPRLLYRRQRPNMATRNTALPLGLSARPAAETTSPEPRFARAVGPPCRGGALPAVSRSDLTLASVRLAVAP
jgi:hypothetical protein